MKALAQNTLIQNRYLIVQLIGKGGMGEVYLAVDQRLGSAVALKRTFFAGDEMLGNAFEREARTLARMRHPVLPKVSDHFGEGDEQYLVMEHISGDDLAKRLEIAQKPFPASWVLFWADQLLDALSYLHSHEPQIIHRDIKPQNLKLTDENYIILLDFGLSKTSTGQTNIKQSGSTGSVVGYTPHYAPMEQIRGIGTSARSDLYSLSATLYQLLTNTIPSDALSRADSMLNGMPDPIQPISVINPEIPKSVSDVILKGMEVSQEKRFANAREMQKILRKAFTEMQDGAGTESAAYDVQERQRAAIDQPLASSLAQTEVLVPDRVSQPVSGASQSPDSGDFAGNSSGEPDFDATIANDSVIEGASVRQADVKTEVFLAGSIPLPPPPEQYSGHLSKPQELIEGHSLSGGFDSGDDKIHPPENEQHISLQDDAENGFSVDEQVTKESYGASTSSRDAFSTVTSPYLETQAVEAEREEAVSPLSRQAAVSRPQKKKSSGGVFAVVGGGFAALLILGAFAAGGGWYYYSNFYAADNDAAPVPSPEMSVEFTPSPEQTLEEVFSSNSLENSNSEYTTGSNTNSNAGEDITVVPAPVLPPATGTAPRSTPQATVRNVPSRPVTAPEKATPRPTPKPTVDRTKILQ
ncbi:hypothetical protein BH18ACI3_BH18ACI3_00500 [soil metagenome]